LILRGVSFEFRNKVEHPGWKKTWDTCFFIGSAAPALLFGVAFANIFQGIPIDGEGIYHGTLFTLLNPYGIAGGILFVLLFLLHGSLWLALKTEGDLHRKAATVGEAVWLALLVMAVAFLIATWFATDLYDNYFAHPILLIVLLLTVLALLAIRLFIGQQAYFKAWIASAVTIFGTTSFGVIGLFPNMFPSSIDPAFSLTAFNASSSPLTLTIMLVVALIFVPIVLVYQLWAYRLFSGKQSLKELMSEEAY
jgi:cytochrome d ubiquinol oxidase subunit II